MNSFSLPFKLSSPVELIAAVPYMLGFHPQDSVVALGLDGQQPVWTLSMDTGGSAEMLASQAVDAALHPTIARPRMVLLGYGSPDAEVMLADVAMMLAESGVPVVRNLRVHENRYYCLDCARCPATGGIDFDSSATNAAATATLAGLVAFPSRKEFLLLAAADPSAQQRLESLLDSALANLGRPESSRDLALVDAALAAARDGDTLTDEQAAQLVIVLLDKTVRDHAWLATDAQPWQRKLWFDLLRRVPEQLTAPVACLAAWCCGDTLTAIAALDRAVLADPSHSLAVLLRALVEAGQSPSNLIPQWPIPELLDPAAPTVPQTDSRGRPLR